MNSYPSQYHPQQQQQQYRRPQQQQYQQQPQHQYQQRQQPYIPLSPPLERQPSQHLCLYPQCVGVAFSRFADLQRHVLMRHNPESVQKVDCEWLGCPRKGANGFNRKDKAVEHMREVHHADLPKRSPGKRSP